MNFVEKTISKLRAVQWSTGPQQATTESLECARTYLCLFANFVYECRVERSADITAFTSPARILGLDEAPLSQVIMAECESLAKQSSNAYDCMYAKRALQWAALCDLSHPATCGREDLFEPLLHLVANRIPAMVRKGYWVVDENMFPLLNWETRYAAAGAVASEHCRSSLE